MSCYWRWGVVAGLVALSPVWAGAEKPAGGICECGIYPEAPALCAPLSGAQRTACITSNAHWTDQCGTWRSEICRAADASNGAAKMSEPPRLAARPAPAVPPEVEKFGGSWAGQAQCRAAADKWRLTMLLVQTADGKLLTTATTSQAMDTFSRGEFKDNNVTLHFSTLLSKKVYAGRLVAPNRIEGTVHVAGSDCTWYLTR